MKLFPKVLLAVLAVFLLMQVARPEQTNPPVTGDVGAPPEVAAILKKACYDCHSNETKWPWYSQVAPVSWLVANHVKDGRKHLNFSEWQGYEDGRKLKKLEETAEEVGEGEMPIPGYSALHAEAKLTDAEKKAIVEWAKSAR
ncbi:MAG TPA: heme-binding domain-containing protein [Archangium sp.]